MEIPIYYDPMIAKLAVHADTREEACDRMIRAIDEYRISGVQTTLGFCRFVMGHEAFRSGKFDTHFVKQHFSPELLMRTNDDEAEMAAIVATLLAPKVSVGTHNGQQAMTTNGVSAWKLNRTR
jgi:acetyl-CoA carboxylase, biotin carboxylase subunit